MNRRECKLLPHISQPLYGLSPHDIQFLPWESKDLMFKMLGNTQEERMLR